MKRIFIALSLLCVPLLAFSENKIKMVTYFPVPYVAYSKINASKQLDIGLTSACEMNLGCSESGALGIRPLQATTVNLNRGKLDLNTASAVKSTNVTLGSGSGEANIDFSANLRIGTLNNGYSLEASDMTVDELKLFASHMKSGGEKFPSCAATGASGAPQVSWQKVKLKKAEEVYLVCGTPEEQADPCAGQVKSKWDGTRCVCPGSYDYYVAASGACCSYLTPKTDTRCWTEIPAGSGVWKWQLKVDSSTSCTYQKNLTGTISCHCSDYTNTCASGVAEGVGCVENTPEGGYQGSSGETCTLSCEQRDVESDSWTCNNYPSNCTITRTLYYKQLVCLPEPTTETTYKARWNAATDKNY